MSVLLFLHKQLLREESLQLLGRETQAELALYSHRDASRLFGTHYGYGIGVLRYAERSTVTQSQFLGDILVVGHGQDTSRSAYTALAYNHGTVVQRGVLEEDVLYQTLVDIGVYGVARRHDVVKRSDTLYDYQRTDLLACHVHARHDDRHDGAHIGSVRGMFVAEKSHEGSQTLMCAEGVEELAYLFLEKHYYGKDTDRDELVEDTAEEAHLQYLAHEEPYDDKHHDAYEDIQRAGLAHQAENIVQQGGDEDYIDDVLGRYFYEHKAVFGTFQVQAMPHDNAAVKLSFISFVLQK